MDDDDDYDDEDEDEDGDDDMMMMMMMKMKMNMKTKMVIMMTMMTMMMMMMMMMINGVAAAGCVVVCVCGSGCGGCCGGGHERQDEVQLILIMMIMIQNLQHHRLVQDAPSALHMAYGMWSQTPHTVGRGFPTASTKTKGGCNLKNDIDMKRNIICTKNLHFLWVVSTSQSPSLKGSGFFRPRKNRLLSWEIQVGKFTIFDQMNARGLESRVIKNVLK